MASLSVSLPKALDKIKPHDHLCLMYETPEEWRAAVIPFMAKGLKLGERCVYVVDSHTTDEVCGYLRQEGVDVAAAEASGQLVILHETEAYSREGSFDPDRMIALLIGEAEKALAQGYPALRVTREMSWVLRGHPGSERLLEYEAKLNRHFFPKYPCLALCQYEWRSFDPQTIKGVMRTHPLMVRGDRVLANTYYLPPQQYLSQGADQREVEAWLENLERQRQGQERVTLLADVLDHSSQPFVVAYPDGRLMTWNPAFCQLTDYSDEELSALSSIRELTPLKWHRREAKALKELCATGQPQRYEEEFLRRDGSPVPVEVFIHQVRDTGGNVCYNYLFITDIAERKQAEQRLRLGLERLRRVLEGVVQAMALTVEMRDPYTAGHERRVTELACAIAGEMDLSRDQIEGMRIAGLLHDIGKIAAPAEILSKPGRMTEVEYSMIKIHCQVGYDILKEIEFPWPVAQIVLQHHERMDGSGYPLALSGEGIILQARILAVADVVEAMASHRPYRPALGIEAALEEISQNSGIHYDPDVVNACLWLFRQKGFEFE